VLLQSLFIPVPASTAGGHAGHLPAKSSYPIAAQDYHWQDNIPASSKPIAPQPTINIFGMVITG
jgi:hypothetical protein